MKKDVQTLRDRHQDTVRELDQAREVIRWLEEELAETNRGLISLTIELEKANERLREEIEEHKEAEEALSKRNRDIEAILNSTTDSAFLLSIEGRFIALNDATAQRFGKDVDEMIGKPFSAFLPSEAAAYRTARLNDVIKVRRPVRFEDVRNGRTYDSTFYPILGPDGVVEGIAAFVSDVTDRMRLRSERECLIDELEVKNAELERFIYSVSHDLRSPLITIKTFLGFVRDGMAKGTADSLESDMSRIDKAADKMGELLDEILELSRIGRLSNPPSSVPAEELVKEALELLGGAIAQSGAEVQMASDLPFLYGDRTRLVEMFQNLIHNAVKFRGDQPHPKVEIGCRKQDDELVFYVRDNGIGIDARYHEKIFGLFDQLNPTEEGTGIGLALVKRIIEVHGGRIWVESEGAGHGSTFCFALPGSTLGKES